MDESSMELMDLIDEFLRDSLGFVEEFLCHVCGEKLPDDTSLQQHLESHDVKELKCLFCSSCDMNDHLSLTDFDLPDLLDVYELERDFQEIEKPFEEVLGQEKIQCEICGKIMLKSSMGNHLRIKHSTEKPFECEKCGKCYKSRGSLKFHQENHEERSKSWTCEKCGSSFFDGKSLQAHMRRLHSSSATNSCPVCRKSFRTSYDLKYHREIVHLTFEKRFKCRICYMSFKGRQGLRRHESRHREGEVLSLKCSFCEVKFAEDASWRRHEENCSDQKKYECKYCPEKFTTYIRLRGHRRREHQEKILRRSRKK